MRYGMKNKLSSRYIELYKILDKIDDVAYKLALPLALAKLYNVFHASIINVKEAYFILLMSSKNN